MKSYTTTIGDNEYCVMFGLNNGIYSYELLRNGKLQSSTTAPEENKDDIKMWIAEKVTQLAIYDINHFVGKIDLD